MKQALNYNSADTTLSGAATEEIQKGTITVPDLVGQNIDFAASILNEKGIKYVVDPATSGTTVGSQSLPTNSVYDPNTELILALGNADSTAAGTVIVPDLKGLSIQSANEILTGLGLNLKITGNGFASSQTPAATTVVEKGSDVSVTFTP